MKQVPNQGSFKTKYLLKYAERNTCTGNRQQFHFHRVVIRDIILQVFPQN